MDDYSDFLDFPFIEDSSKESPNTLLALEDGERECFFICGEDNWDCFAGRNLLDFSLEAGFVYDRIKQLLLTEGFIPIQEKLENIRYLITSNCSRKQVKCLDLKENMELDPCQLMTFEELKDSGIGPTMEMVIETNCFADNSMLSDEEWAEYMRQREEDNKWEPAYPIDLNNLKPLTFLQKERGEKLYNALEEFPYNQPKDNHCPPEVCISQDWDISVDFEGWRNDTDIIRSAYCFMCQDEENGSFYLNKEYVKQCVPFLEEELEDISDDYLYKDGVLFDKDRTKNEIRWDMEQEFSKIVSDFINKKCSEDTVIAIDTNSLLVFSLPQALGIADEPIRIYNPKEYVLSKLGWKPMPNQNKIVKLIKSLTQQS